MVQKSRHVSIVMDEEVRVEVKREGDGKTKHPKGMALDFGDGLGGFLAKAESVVRKGRAKEKEKERVAKITRYGKRCMFGDGHRLDFEVRE